MTKGENLGIKRGSAACDGPWELRMEAMKELTFELLHVALAHPCADTSGQSQLASKLIHVRLYFLPDPMSSLQRVATAEPRVHEEISHPYHRSTLRVRYFLAVR